MCLPSQKIALPKVFKTFEAIAVETRIGTKDIIFLVMYRPPKQTSKRNDKQFKYYETVEQEINDIVMWASLKKQFVIVMGDLNMDRLKPNDREGKILKDLEEVNSLQCMITEPTRITMNSQTLLDVLLTNSPEVFRKCGTYNPEISDHYLIYGIMSQKIRKHEPKVIIFRSIKNTNQERLNQDLLEAPWHVAEVFDDIDDKYVYWNGLLESVLNEHVPLRRKIVCDKDIPYMTLAWKKAIRNKRKYAVQFSKNRTQENFELKKEYRNIATRERRKAIKHYWRKKSEELNEKPSEFYKTFRPFLNNKSTNSSEISLRNEDGNIITDQLEVADLLANYFTYAAANVGGDHVRN